MNEKINFFQKMVNIEKTKKSILKKDIIDRKRKIKELCCAVDELEQAHLIIQHVALQTQKEIELEISEIVTLALCAVYEEDDYEFCLDFEFKRGKTEAMTSILKNGYSFDLMDATDSSDDSGGGILDIISFAVRVACWKISNPAPANTMFLDEPFKWISAEYKPAAIDMLKMIGDKLKIQIVMVTHDKEFIEVADKVFKVSTKKKDKKTGLPISQVVEV
jgi:hypothetical protein